MTPFGGGRPPAGAIWAADTGCFRQPESFHLDKYLRWLERRGPRESCLFVTAPDVLADADETLIRSRPVLSRLREEGWNPALVAQDGLTIETTPWDEIAALFIGGSLEWKESRIAAELVQEANRRGVHAHIGRVNTPERLLFAQRAGADSVDGTRLAFGFDANWQDLREWVRCINGQLSFF